MRGSNYYTFDVSKPKYMADVGANLPLGNCWLTCIIVSKINIYDGWAHHDMLEVVLKLFL